MPGKKGRTQGRAKRGSSQAKGSAKARGPKGAGTSARANTKFPTGQCICLKVHVQGPNRLIAACDFDILGLTFREREARLEVAKGFYYEEMVDADTLVRFLRTATMANLVGKNVVRLAVEAGFIDQDCVLLVEGVPHAQLLVCK